MIEDNNKIFKIADDAVYMWLEDDSAIHVKAITKSGDPVELSKKEARLMAAELLRLAKIMEDLE